MRACMRACVLPACLPASLYARPGATHVHSHTRALAPGAPTRDTFPCSSESARLDARSGMVRVDLAVNFLCPHFDGVGGSFLLPSGIILREPSVAPVFLPGNRLILNRAQ